MWLVYLRIIWGAGSRRGYYRSVAQQKSPHEDFIMFFLVCFIVGGLAWVIWHFFQVQLTWLVQQVRIGELWLIKILFGDNTTITDAEIGRQVSGTWRRWLQKTTADKISVDDIKASTMIAVLPLKLVFLAIMGVMTVFVIFRGPGTQYRRRMGLEQLMMEQAKVFPAISPFLKFDPRKLPQRSPGQPVPEQLPLFSEMLSPEEWLAYNSVRYQNGQLDYAACWRALEKQLGKRWQGPEALPIHMQGLYAVCALKLIRKRKESELLLNMLAESWSADKGFRPSAKLKSKIRTVIKNPKMGVALQKFADQHAYETTAMLRCLQRAREEGGVLAPAEFLWLRGHDRALWYPLNNLGRRSYAPEAAGALVHFTNELIAGQKIPTPRVDEVIRGLEAYLKGPSARPIPELQKKGAKADD